MLYDLFSWMSNSWQNEMTFIHPREVTRSEIVEEQKSALSTLRHVVAKYRTAQYEAAAHSPRIQSAKAQLSQQQAYLSFLNHLLSSLNNAEHGSLIQLTLNYLWSQKDDSAITTLAALFPIYWLLDKEQVHLFYEQNNAALPAQLHRAYFQEALILKTDPLSVVPLIKQWVDEPETLAGAVLWLLEQSVPAEALLETGLLHHFLHYHLHQLHSDDSPVVRFYAILERFPCTLPLIAQAQQISCDSRGLESYSLTGQHSRSKLEKLGLNKKTRFFAETTDDFPGLYRVFGLAFVKEVFFQHVLNTDAVSNRWLQSLLNNEKHLPDVSALILLLTQQEEVAQLLPCMAQLLNKETKKQLLAQNDCSAFYFLPYDPELCTDVHVEQMESWLHQSEEADVFPFEMIARLGSMLPLFATTNQAIFSLLYAKLIAMVLKHPTCLDDDHIVTLLKKYGQNNSLLAKAANDLEEEFNACLKNYATQPFTTRQYYKIEDAWLSVSRRLYSLQKIHDFGRSCPRDKYALQACIGKRLVTQNSASFDLSAFSQALEITATIKRKKVTAYERLLVEMLVSIDNDALRAAVFNELGDKSAGYAGEQFIFKRAVVNGNAGLLKQMMRSHPRWLKDKLIKSSLRHGVEGGHWTCVKLLCERSVHNVDKALLKEILIGATEAGDKETVAFLAQAFNHKLTSQDGILSTAFQAAIKNGRQSMVKLYCETYKLNCTDFLGGIQLAYQAKQEPLLSYLLANVHSFIPHSELQTETDALFTREAARGRVDLMMEWLPRLEKVQPSKKSLIAGCTQAAKKGNQDMFERMYAQLEEESRPHALSSSLFAATKAGNIQFLNRLCQFILPQFINHKIIKSATNKAIKRAESHQNEAILSRLKQLKSALKKPAKPIPQRTKNRACLSIITHPNASAAPKSATPSPLLSQSFFALNTVPRAKSASFLPVFTDKENTPPSFR